MNRTPGTKTNNPKSLMMFISSMLIFGTIGIFRKNLLLPSAFIACVRGIFGGLFILAYSIVRRRTAAKKLPGRILLQLIFSGAVMGINWILLFEAYNYTTVAVATLCYYMQPTIVMLVSPMIFGEKLTGRKAVCALIAIAGMVLISGVADGGNAQTGDPKGILLGLGAAVCYSVVYLLATGGFDGIRLDAGSIGFLAVIGLVHTGIAYVLYFGSIDGMRAQSIAIFSYIDPVSALLFSALLLREPLSASGVIGAVMIIGSAIASEMKAG